MTFFITRFLQASLLISLVLSLHAYSQTQGTVDHSKWQTILDNYLVDGGEQGNLFKYGDVSDADIALLDSYITDMQDIDASKLEKDEQFAYWVNVYNAVTISLVVADYPVDSIMQIGSIEGKGPWDDPAFATAEQELTLNDIEHGILRAQFKDPRVHYAVNCASLGCPNLSGTAFTARNTEQQLEEGAKQFVNSAKGVHFADGKLVLSSIYQWFVTDFGGSEDRLMEHLLQYADTELQDQLESYIDAVAYDYNWQLNGK